MRYFLLRDSYHHHSDSCLTNFVYLLVATALGFLVSGGVRFNIYLRVGPFDPPSPPPNNLLSLGPPLDSKFDAVRGPIVPYAIGKSVETTGLYRVGHAVETMDADSEAPALLSEDIP